MSRSDADKSFYGPQRIRLKEIDRFTLGNGTVEPGARYVLSGTAAGATFAISSPSDYAGSTTIVRALGGAMTLSGSGNNMRMASGVGAYDAGDLLTIASGQTATLFCDGQTHTLVFGSGSIA